MMFDYYETTAGDDALRIVTDNKVTIDLLYAGDDMASLILIDEYDWPTHSDTLHGLFVKINGEIMSLTTLVNEANLVFPAIKDEVLQEEDDARDMDSYLSSPSRTGRI